MEIKICHLYPELLNLSGDSGNISCLVKRLEWRGIAASVTRLQPGDERSLRGFDIVYIGGAEQDFGALEAELARGRREDIRAAVEDGVVFVTVCAGFQLMGRYFETADGQRSELVGAADMYTLGAKERFTGDYAFRFGDITVVGFENHSGRTWLAGGMEPLGKLVSGHGSNGEDGTEGLRYKNLYGSYAQGPLLPKNPALCDDILKTALDRKYGPVELEKLDDSMESKAHELICKRLG